MDTLTELSPPLDIFEATITQNDIIVINPERRAEINEMTRALKEELQKDIGAVGVWATIL